MYTNIVKNQYVGKSKIDFTFYGQPLPKNALIGDLGLPFQDENGVPYNLKCTYLPDYFIFGDISDISTMNMPGKTKILYITGIPKFASRLEDYRLKDAIWSSYYEDKYRGYLFQVLNADTLVQLKNENINPQFKIKVNLR